MRFITIFKTIMASICQKIHAVRNSYLNNQKKTPIFNEVLLNTSEFSFERICFNGRQMSIILISEENNFGVLFVTTSSQLVFLKQINLKKDNFDGKMNQKKPNKQVSLTLSRVRWSPYWCNRQIWQRKALSPHKTNSTHFPSIKNLAGRLSA